jgi:hypothetical protein
MEQQNTPQTQEKSSQGLKCEAHYQGQTLDDAGIDAWELKAAKRALRNLKTLLAGQAMMDLLADEIRESDQFHNSLIAQSNGEYREARTDMRVPGFRAQQLVDSMVRGFAKGFDVQETLASHPEHYVLPPQYTQGMVETIGGLPTRFKVVSLPPTADLPAPIAAYVDPSYPIAMTGVLYLDDDTPFAYAIHQLRDTDGACELALRIIYPAAAPESMIQEHSEHLAIEFRAFIRQAITASE